MTAVVMVILAAAVAAWVLAPLRNATGPADPHGRGPAGDVTAREVPGDEGPGDTMGRTLGGER